MGKKHVIALYEVKVEDTTKRLDVARAPFNGPFLQHTHLLQICMKKIHNDLMNQNEALKHELK
jgi:hypothetical protein